MRSATIFAAAVAMATSVSAQIDGFAVFAKPATDESVTAGTKDGYEITWAAGKYSGPAVISLIGGATQLTQVPIGVVATIPEVGANKYTWKVDCALGTAKVYGLKIALVNKPEIWQWSNRFHIDNSACSGQASYSPSASASSSAALTATSATSDIGSASATAYPTATASASASGSAYPTKSASSSSAAASASGSASASVSATHSHSAPVQTMSSSTKAATPSTTGGSNPIPTAAAHKVAAGSFILAGVAAALAL